MDDADIAYLKDCLKHGMEVWWRPDSLENIRIDYIGKGPIIPNEDPEPSEVAYYANDPKGRYIALYNVGRDDMYVTTGNVATWRIPARVTAKDLLVGDIVEMVDTYTGGFNRKIVYHIDKHLVHMARPFIYGPGTPDKYVFTSNMELFPVEKTSCIAFKIIERRPPGLFMRPELKCERCNKPVLIDPKNVAHHLDADGCFDESMDHSPQLNSDANLKLMRDKNDLVSQFMNAVRLRKEGEAPNNNLIDLATRAALLELALAIAYYKTNEHQYMRLSLASALSILAEAMSIEDYNIFAPCVSGFIKT